jgi:hypothetical protein
MTPDGETVLTIDEARNDGGFQEQCLEILKAYYVNPEVPLQYALDREATHVYLASVGARLAGFFFARIPEQILQDRPRIGYMGLTAAVNGGDQRLARRLWKKYLDHARRQNNGREIWVWYRTASPFGLYPCHSLLRDGEPRLDGSFSSEGAALIGDIRLHYGLPADRAETKPFVVRGFASARYTEHEKDRIERFSRPEAARLFHDFGIDEANGDRLLMIGRIPQ